MAVARYRMICLVFVAAGDIFMNFTTSYFLSTACGRVSTPTIKTLESPSLDLPAIFIPVLPTNTNPKFINQHLEVMFSIVVDGTLF